MIRIDLPTNERTVRGLKCGDYVEIFGIMMTGRDAAHAYLFKQHRPEFVNRLKGTFIYHCGPVVKKVGSGYEVLSAGPTTSTREEPYQSKVIADYGIRGVIGKGGMGQRTLDALKEFGAVYLSAVGGAGALAAASIKKVRNVYLLDEMGVPDAFWELEVEGFPAIVTMDAHGESLHKKVRMDSERVFKEFIEQK
jgi:fumarate hydratase subunit beta